MEITESLLQRWLERHRPPREQVARLRASAGRDAHELMRLAMAEKLLSRDAAGSLLADEARRTYVKVEQSTVRADLIAKITTATAMRLGAVPLYQVG